MNIPDILIVVTSNSEVGGKETGLWLEEFMAPYMIFRKDGYGITVTSPKGGEVPLDQRSIEGAQKLREQSQQSVGASAATQPKGEEFLFQEGMEVLKNTQKLSDVDPQEYQVVYFPGGHGTMGDLPTRKVSEVVRHFMENDKIVAAVCHGPAAFVEAKGSGGESLIKGRKLTSFTNAEEEEVGMKNDVPFLLESRLRELGAHFQGASNWSDNVVADGKLITGQNPQSAESLAMAVTKALHQEEVTA